MEKKDLNNLAPDENYIPTGLPGGFFIYNALGDQEIYFADQNVIELFLFIDRALLQHIRPVQRPSGYRDYGKRPQ